MCDVPSFSRRPPQKGLSNPNQKWAEPGRGAPSLSLTSTGTLSQFFKENLPCPLFIATPSFFQDQKLQIKAKIKLTTLNRRNFVMDSFTQRGAS